MDKLKKYYGQTGGNAAILENKEYVKTNDGQVLKIKDAPKHENKVLKVGRKNKKVPFGKGGVVVPNVESALSATHENRTSKSKLYTYKDEEIKIMPKEVEAVGKLFALPVKLQKKAISPAKLLDLLVEKRDSTIKRYKDPITDRRSDSRFNAIAANRALLATLPTKEDLYDGVFQLQESKKSGEFENAFGQTGISEDQKARNKAYKTIRPSDETDINNYARWLTNTQREEWDDAVSEEAFGLYTKQNKPLKYLRPTNNPNPEWDKQHKDKQMYRLHDAFESDLKHTYFDKMKVGEQRLVNERELKSKDFKPVNILGKNNEDSDNIMQSRARVLRQYTVNKNKDDKGKEYLEYRDIYDLPEIFQDRIKGVPFGVSGRVYQEGGIPERYKNKGFTKVGVKKQAPEDSSKKWQVLAKKGDKYKIVSGGYRGMEDFTQHGDKDRQKNFWNRMGGKDSAKANDEFNPLFWHKKFGTWQTGPEKTKLKSEPYMKGSRPALGTNSGKSIEVLDGRTISMDQIYDADSVIVKGNEGKTFYKNKLKKYIK